MKKTNAKIKNEAINSSELILAIEELEKEKGIDKDSLLESIQTALVTAYKRNFDSAENVKVTMDGVTGEIHVYAEKEVVATAKDIENDKLQISLEDAKKINKKLDVGDVAEIEQVPKEFGRIAAQTAKQVIIQKSVKTLVNSYSTNLAKEKEKLYPVLCKKQTEELLY